LQTEYEDPPEEKAKKMRQLVDIVRSAQNLVVYTGAGVRLVTPPPLFSPPTLFSAE
jgi:thiamine pyrophosphate-dependent acetolactate synthase large subunit-like protein